MGIFDWLKGKKTPAHPKSYEPVNRLETMLRDGARNPEMRGRFYREIFHFRLLVIGSLDEKPDGSRTALFQTSTLPGKFPFVRAFTSKEALQYVVTRDQLQPLESVEIPALDLFEMLKGQTGIAINPGFDYGVVLSPQDIEALLMEPAEPQALEVPAGSRIRVGQPVQWPKGYLEALRSCIQGDQAVSGVQDIHVGLYQMGDSPHALLGVVEFRADAPQESQLKAIQDLGKRLNERVTEQIAMDFMVMNPGAREWVRDGALLSVRGLSK